MLIKVGSSSKRVTAVFCRELFLQEKNTVTSDAAVNEIQSVFSLEWWIGIDRIGVYQP